MHAKVIVVAALAALVSAVPGHRLQPTHAAMHRALVAPRDNGTSPSSAKIIPLKDDKGKVYFVPPNSNASRLAEKLNFTMLDGEELPDPPAGLTLKYLLYGIGVRMYKCPAGAGDEDMPTYTGMVGGTYDAMAMYDFNNSFTEANPPAPADWYSMSVVANLQEEIERLDLPLHMKNKSMSVYPDYGKDDVKQTDLMPASSPYVENLSVHTASNGVPIAPVGFVSTDANGALNFTMDGGSSTLSASAVQVDPIGYYAFLGPESVPNTLSWAERTPWQLQTGDDGPIKAAYEVLTASGGPFSCGKMGDANNDDGSKEGGSPFAALYYLLG